MDPKSAAAQAALKRADDQWKGAHGSLPTMPVTYKGGDGGIVNINVDDFDEDKHERVEQKKASAKKDK